MVQCLLIGTRAVRMRYAVSMALVAILLAVPASGAKKQKTGAAAPWPELLLEGGRKLTYERTIANERDIRGKKGFWTKLSEIVVGEPDYKQLVRPFGIAMDSRGRMIVTDPGIAGVHIFDIKQNKYKFIERQENGRDSMIEPQCVAVDAKDNIYVTDSKAGKIFVFEPSGKFKSVFGSIKGEGFFKRPTGISIDPDTQNVYVTDTLRNKIFILNLKGEVLKSFGEAGIDNGQFNYPTEIHAKNGVVAVVDSMNFRVQLFDRDGKHQGTIGVAGDPNRGIYRPKGLAIDSEDHVYLVEGEWGLVQVFDRNGNLLYNFGNGTGFGQFLLPAGLFIDGNDRLYLVDSYNRRVQIFQYHALKRRAEGSR